MEDGKGWIAGGQMHVGGSIPGGLRVFNVGVTRARHRLYLIANEAVIQRAERGALLALRATAARRDGCTSSEPLRSSISGRNRKMTALRVISGMRCATT